MSESSSPAATALDRRTLLRATVVAGGLTALGNTPALGSTSALLAGSQFGPQDLDFHVVRRQRQIHLVADRFVTLRDDFSRAVAYEVVSPDARPGTVSRSNGRLSMSGDHFTLLKSATGQVAPYAAVVVKVDSFAGAADEDKVYAGLVKDAQNYVLAWYDRVSGDAGVDVSVDGAVQTLGSAPAGQPATPFQFAFALTSSTVVAFVDDGQRPVPIVQVRLDDHIDLRSPAALRTYRNAFGSSASSGTTTLDSVKAGYFGELGMRDPHLVTHADGRPYIIDGKAYFTFTNAGLAFFETAHWAVWTVDLRTYRLEQVGNLFFQRDGSEAVLGDHAGHIVRDEANDRWILAMSTWGDFDFTEVHVNYTTVPLSEHVLHGVHVLHTQRLHLPVQQLPTAHVGQWDPHLVQIDRRWYVAFVNARKFFDFFPSLSRSPLHADFTQLRLVGADTSKIATEGTVMQKVGERWYVLASNGDDSPARIRNQYPVYDLQMNQLDILDAPHPTNIPWPMLFPVKTSHHRARWVLVTFNGTQFHEDLLGFGTHGDVIAMEAAERTRYPFA
jgi:hypothetical protein